MRSEFAPFGIKVVDLKTAGVRTNFYDNIGANDLQVKLPANSMYQPAREAIETMMQGKEVMKDAHEADVWAKRVVGDLTKSNPPWEIWRGQRATMVWFASLFPSWFMDKPLKDMSGVTELEKALKKQETARS